MSNRLQMTFAALLCRVRAVGAGSNARRRAAFPALLGGLLLAFTTTGLASSRRPPDWTWPAFELAQTAMDGSRNVLDTLAACLKPGTDCNRTEIDALWMLQARMDIRPLKSLARLAAARTSLDGSDAGTAHHVLAIGGDGARLKARLEASPGLVQAWALAMGGDHAFDSVALDALGGAAPGDVCNAARLSDPFIRSDAPLAQRFRQALLDRLVDSTARQAPCVEDAVERHWQLLGDAVADAAQRHVDDLLKADDAHQQRRGQALAARWLLRLPDRDAKASDLVRAAATADESDWVAANRGAVAQALLAQPFVPGDPQWATAYERVEVISGPPRRDQIEWLLAMPADAVWRTAAAELTVEGAFEFLHAASDNRQEPSPRDLPAKRLLLQNVSAVQADPALRAALGGQLITHAPGAGRRLLENAYAQMPALQQTALAARHPSVFPLRRSASAWREALAAEDPWLRLAAQLNASVACGEAMPPGWPGATPPPAAQRASADVLARCRRGVLPDSLASPSGGRTRQVTE
ncbi:hypothetical protein [Tahibacter amnicola]|uniref:Uncharacterized protein n=1 Tax=Tahibacter amnicola TaxID=2976241 RepID=A0ABY6BF21_9GAMM|nr:hypothetical protein [Tahibacter amnicola]UXI68191.1 hypothetical protein N4264_00625 [Tahibacter amnicola]